MELDEVLLATIACQKAEEVHDRCGEFTRVCVNRWGQTLQLLDSHPSTVPIPATLWTSLRAAEELQTAAVTTNPNSKLESRPPLRPEQTENSDSAMESRPPLRPEQTENSASTMESRPPLRPEQTENSGTMESRPSLRPEQTENSDTRKRPFSEMQNSEQDPFALSKWPHELRWRSHCHSLPPTSVIGQQVLYYATSTPRVADNAALRLCHFLGSELNLPVMVLGIIPTAVASLIEEYNEAGEASKPEIRRADDAHLRSLASFQESLYAHNIPMVVVATDDPVAFLSEWVVACSTHIIVTDDDHHVEDMAVVSKLSASLLTCAVVSVDSNHAIPARLIMPQHATSLAAAERALGTRVEELVDVMSSPLLTPLRASVQKPALALGKSGGKDVLSLLSITTNARVVKHANLRVGAHEFPLTDLMCSSPSASTSSTVSPPLTPSSTPRFRSWTEAGATAFLASFCEKCLLPPPCAADERSSLHHDLSRGGVRQDPSRGTLDHDPYRGRLGQDHSGVGREHGHGVAGGVGVLDHDVDRGILDQDHNRGVGVLGHDNERGVSTSGEVNDRGVSILDHNNDRGVNILDHDNDRGVSTSGQVNDRGVSILDHDNDRGVGILAACVDLGLLSPLRVLKSCQVHNIDYTTQSALARELVFHRARSGSECARAGLCGALLGAVQKRQFGSLFVLLPSWVQEDLALHEADSRSVCEQPVIEKAATPDNRFNSLQRCLAVTGVLHPGARAQWLRRLLFLTRCAQDALHIGFSLYFNLASDATSSHVIVSMLISAYGLCSPPPAVWTLHKPVVGRLPDIG